MFSTNLVQDENGIHVKVAGIAKMFVLFYIIVLCTVFFVSRAESNILSSTFPQRRLERYQYHPLLEHCREKGEAYSASFLVRKDFFLQTMERLIIGRTGSIHGENTTRLYQGEAWLQRRKTLLKNANVELATFAMMSHVTDMVLEESGADYDGGRIYQSIDFLDFSVLHLSTYERLLHRYCEHEKVKQAYEDYSPIEEATEFLKQKGIYRSQGHKNHLSQQHVHRKASNDAPNYFHQTLVVMPYLGYTQGEGNSKIIYRQRYLAACFWSFFAYYPHIVIAVTSEEDRDYILSHSGLPVFDVLFLPGLPTPAALPLASVVATARKMSTYGDNNNKPFPTPTEEYQDDVPRMSNNAKKAKRRVWKQQFDYVFYTESDQMLVMKSEERMMHMYQALDKEPTRRWDQDFMLAPHRLTVYPEAVLSNIYKFPSPYLASTKDVQLQQQQQAKMNLSTSLPFLPVKTKDGQEISSTTTVLSSFTSEKPVTGHDNNKQKKKHDKNENSELHVGQEKPKVKNTTVSWQCCQPPSQMCRRPREEWSPLTSKSLQSPAKSPFNPGKVPSPQLISIFHPRLYVALGNVDFHYEQFHSCRLTQHVASHRNKNELETCPNE